MPHVLSAGRGQRLKKMAKTWRTTTMTKTRTVPKRKSARGRMKPRMLKLLKFGMYATTLRTLLQNNTFFCHCVDFTLNLGISGNMLPLQIIGQMAGSIEERICHEGAKPACAIRLLDLRSCYLIQHHLTLILFLTGVQYNSLWYPSWAAIAKIQCVLPIIVSCSP